MPKSRALRRVSLIVPAAFACGTLLGVALAPLVPHLLHGAARAEASSTNTAIAKVAGFDAKDPQAAHDSAASGPHDAAGRAARAKHGAGAHEATAAQDPEEMQARHATAAIARRALGFTVFVRGGRVYGAGVLADDQGHVLTCRHVIEGLDQISVTFSDGTTFPAQVVDSDPVLDVALLQIAPGRKSELTPASVTDVELGDDVYAIGAPRKMAFSLSRGMASYVGRPFSGVYYLQTDLAMNAGSSGGPVLDDRGRVIAISSFVLRDSEGLAFALPIDYAYRRFRKQLGTPKALEGSANAAFEGWLSTLERTRTLE
jgi:serine protease Do